MKALDVIKQLQEKIPPQTGLFSDDVPVTTLTSSGLTVTATTSIAHNFLTGNSVVIKGALNPIPITSLTQVDNIATAVTSLDHDLTQGFQESVIIEGADQSEYNGTHTLLTVPNRRTFTFQISGSPASPATGTPIYNEESVKDYNGQKTITVTSPTEFTYALTRALESPAQGTIVARGNRRIAGAVSLIRALESYTAQAPDKLWLFVVLDSTNSNNSRFIQSDAVDTWSRGTLSRQRLIQGVDIYVVVPSTESEPARDIRDSMEDVQLFLFKALLGTKFASGLSEQQWAKLVFVSSSFQDYVGPYYVHKFSFQTTFDITFDDTVGVPDTVAFRDISIDFQNPDDTDSTILEADIDLDNEPL